MSGRAQGEVALGWGCPKLKPPPLRAIVQRAGSSAPSLPCLPLARRVQTDVSFGLLGGTGVVAAAQERAPQMGLLASPTPGKENTGPRPGGPLILGWVGGQELGLGLGLVVGGDGSRRVLPALSCTTPVALPGSPPLPMPPPFAAPRAPPTPAPPAAPTSPSLPGCWCSKTRWPLWSSFMWPATAPRRPCPWSLQARAAGREGRWRVGWLAVSLCSAAPWRRVQRAEPTATLRLVTVPALSFPAAAGDPTSYSAAIPAAAAAPGALVRWYVRATDTTGETTRDPAYRDTDERQFWGTIVADPSDTSTLPVLEM